MSYFDIDYKIKTVTEKEIFDHLFECKDNFIPSLDKTVDIKDYSKKIFESAITFESWEKNRLIGLVAGYFNDYKNQKGFITNVSVSRNYQGKGIAIKLMKMCKDYAAKYNFNEIRLEVKKNNVTAIKLYQRLGFDEIEVKQDILTMRFIVRTS